mgnify:CR=1 FL=1
MMKTNKALKGQINDTIATSFDTFVDEVDMTEDYSLFQVVIQNLGACF